MKEGRKKDYKGNKQTRKTIEKINKTKSWFIVKINKTDKHLARLKKRRLKMTKISNERVNIIINLAKIKRTIRGNYE